MRIFIVERPTTMCYQIQHIDRVLELFDHKEDVEFYSKLVNNTIIAGKEYNLTVSTYVTPKDNREVDKLR